MPFHSFWKTTHEFVLLTRFSSVSSIARIISSSWTVIMSMAISVTWTTPSVSISFTTTQSLQLPKQRGGYAYIMYVHKRIKLKQNSRQNLVLKSHNFNLSRIKKKVWPCGMIFWANTFSNLNIEAVKAQNICPSAPHTPFDWHNKCKADTEVDWLYQLSNHATLMHSKFKV